MGRRKRPEESAALKDARARFRECESYVQDMARKGAPVHAMATGIAAIGSISEEISRLEGKTQ